MSQECQSESSTAEQTDSIHVRPKQKHNLSKTDIGFPSDFRHISHVGWDASQGFNIKCEDPKLRAFFIEDKTSNDQSQREEQEAAQESEISEDEVQTTTPQRDTMQDPQVSQFLQRAGASKNLLQDEVVEEFLINKKLKRKGKLTKGDIGQPSNFRHVSHVGWSENGFNIQLSASKQTNGKHGERPQSLPAQSSLIAASSTERVYYKNRRNYSKNDIGFPYEFKHLSHISWHPQTGFSINCDDPELDAFLKLAGVTDKQLQDKETRDFIFDFINRHGMSKTEQDEVEDSTRGAEQLVQSRRLTVSSSSIEVHN